MQDTSQAYAPMEGTTDQNRCNKSLGFLAFLSLVALVFFAAAEGAPEWWTVPSGPGSNHVGLWKVCTHAQQQSTVCQSWDSLNSQQTPDHWSLFQSIRGFSIIAVVFSFGGFCGLAMSSYRNDWKIGRLAFSVGAIAVLAGLIATIQAARWKTYVQDEMNDSGGGLTIAYGASFGLEIVAFVLAGVSSAGVFVAGRLANTS